MKNLHEPRCPYQGLIPYEEGDAQFFFGREQETQVIIANLFASSLTLLYGASGVGKSSILRAGVTHSLSQRKDLLVVVFRTWQSNPLNDLKAAVANAAAARLPAEENGLASPEPAANLSEYLTFWSTKLNRSLLLILDQFEEYFLYHTQDDAFITEFSKAVSRSKAPISFLISIREDALAKLDRFEKGIPGVFDNYLRLDHLDRQAGRAAIIKPLKRYNELRNGGGAQKIDIEEQLVIDVLDQVKTGEVQLGEVGRGGQNLSDGDARIETPFLQVVMTRLWNEEMKESSNLLRVETLHKLGNAEKIIRTHLDEAMSTLTADEQAIASSVFRYLVTPSGSKIAYSALNLSFYTGVPEHQIVPVLNKLSGEARILHPIAPASKPQAAPQYEIYHDVLATAILDWRRRFMQAQEWRARDENMQLEQKRVSYRRLGLIALLVLIGALMVSLYLNKTARDRENAARSREFAALASKNLSTNSTLSVQQALQAVELSPTQEAIKSLRESLEEYPLLDVVKTGYLVKYVSFSPNGRFLLTGGTQPVAHLWDAATGDLLKTFPGHQGQLFGAIFSQDGRLIATGTKYTTSTVQIWDTNSDTRAIAELTGLEADITQVIFSPDSRLVLTASADRTARIWDARSGKSLTDPLKHPAAINRAAFNQDGTLVVTACADGNAYIWETNGGRLKQTLQGDSQTAYDASFSPDGKSIVVATHDELVRLWDVETGQNTRNFQHENAVYRASFSSDGQRIMSSDGVDRIYVWDANSSLNPITKITNHSSGSFPVFSPDEQLIACGAGASVGIWDLAGNEYKSLKGIGGRLYDPTFSGDGYRLATRSDDGRARIWRVRKQRDFFKIVNAEAPVSFSPDGRFIAVSNQIWNFATGDSVGDPLPYGTHFSSFSPDGKYILIISNDKYSIQIVDARSRSLFRNITSNAYINTAVFSPDGRLLMMLSNDHSVHVWDVNTGETVAEFTDASISQGATFSPDGRYMVTGSNKGTAQIWDIQKGPRQLVKELVGLSARMVSVAYSLDGKFILGEDEDRHMMGWEVQTGERKAQPDGHSGGLSPDGKLLLIINKGKVEVWEWASSKRYVTLESPGGDIADATFSPDGMFIVTIADGIANIFSRERFVSTEELKNMARVRLKGN